VRASESTIVAVLTSSYLTRGFLIIPVAVAHSYWHSVAVAADYGFVKYYQRKEYHENTPPMSRMLHAALKEEDGFDLYKVSRICSPPEVPICIKCRASNIELPALASRGVDYDPNRISLFAQGFPKVFGCLTRDYNPRHARDQIGSGSCPT
jgi:hypothetical protein